ncbi:MAG: tyrosine--tRNA ligase [Candidatus Marinimicrobia bacterium]|jgi:tyrosyl-tRNA synthetase|nr:tyrosine--tRNA ligase [Candidatus Neomarinimicrobiota bacterium]MBT3937559.1 tyrosine--tRNA ligase [Candidatus Neomarinimicrobiota bacterium]MBT3960734.1 tyrosine--tRNA ligase [Candidatus Neomarinimicrobiota bacterium]MBT4382980.1 tyrosine--tRNA ligase [Candidatus Neomarinimicrobiota bacterium]MBT4635124.1 tyrosine--tRNA ligase [Candidatus Neomarinimicrobiota bacterium]
MTFLPVEDQLTLIRRGVEEIIPEEELKSKLEKSIESGIPLIIKLGCDPSRADLHIGHGIVLRKLRHFQDLGHQAVLVIGDFTAMIGDPSGRNKTRPQLTLKEARENAKSYVEQAKVILDINSIKIEYNSEWLDRMNFSDIISLTSSYTVARMLERDDFTKRFKDEIPISLHEFLYPLAQGQDSVELESDVELGGTDQKFNLLVGRDLQRANNQNPQCIITLPLLEGTDGIEKMSKSYGNHIGLHDSPEEMFGKTLSISDDMIEKWFILGADANEEKMEKVKMDLNDSEVNPMTIKRDLARSIVALYYSEEEAQKAEAHFDNVVVSKGIPDDMPAFKISEEKSIVDIISEAGLLQSKSEARRMIKQGAVKLDDEKISDIQAKLTYSDNEHILKVGKRRFLKIIS